VFRLRSREPELRFTFDLRTHCIERERERDFSLFAVKVSYVYIHIYVLNHLSQTEKHTDRR